MTNNSNSKNIDASDFPAAFKGAQLNEYLHKNHNSKLLVLKLEDLNAALIQQLQERQCSMIFLNENFKIVEQAMLKVQHIQLKIDGLKQLVATENIIRLEACGNYTTFYLGDSKKPVLSSRTLKFYVDQLDGTTFVRPHHSHLVNRLFIEQIVLKPQPYFLLKDSKKIKIARRRLSNFRNWEG